MSDEKNKWNVRAISFSGKDWLYEAAAAKAKRLRRSFSNYVCGVLEDDLAKDDPALAGRAGDVALNDAPSSSQTKPPGISVLVEAVKYTNVPRKRPGRTKSNPR